VLTFDAENAEDRVASLLERPGELYGVKDELGVIREISEAKEEKTPVKGVDLCELPLSQGPVGCFVGSPSQPTHMPRLPSEISCPLY